MEQPVLITEAGDLINAADDAEGKGEPEIAKANLLNLQVLLNRELAQPTPTEPETPPPMSPG